MRLLHLHWPNLLILLATARRAGVPSLPSGCFPDGPIVLGGPPWGDGVVLDADPAARALGVRRGMALGAAHRLAPEATFLDPDPEADATTVEAALDRLGAFSPGLAASVDPTDRAFGRIEVQVDGLDRLWGPDEALVGRLTEALGPVLPGRPRAGVAGTRFSAMVAATLAAPGRPVIVPPGDDVAFLAPLPSALLSPDPEVRARLARFGLRHVGAVAAIPRSSLVARFGPEGDRLHARANGLETDSFRPRRSPERALLALPLEPAVSDLEPLRFVLRRLAGALADQLLARGAAAERAQVRLTLEAGAVRGTPARLELDQRFPEPTSDAEAIERLVLARLEREPAPAPVERVEVELLGIGPAAGHQLSIFVPQAARGARLTWQLARLALRFGPDRVLRPELLDPEAPLSEGRVRWQPVGEPSVGHEGRRHREDGS
jgi:protein ImuB